MSGHVFVDESKRHDFLLVAGVVVPGQASTARAAIRGLYLRGQNTIHMVHEGAGRRRLILSTIAQLQLEVTIYLAPKGAFKTELVARQRCLEELVDDMAAAGHSDLLIEQDDTLAAADRRVIAEHLKQQGQGNSIRYRHGKAQSEPLLVIPDAVGWAWPKKGEWRRRCEPIIRKVQILDP